MLSSAEIFYVECYIHGVAGHDLDTCPIDNASPVSCSAFLRIPHWFGIPPKLFFPCLGIGSEQLRSIQRGAKLHQPGSNDPVLVAPLLAIMSRFMCRFGLRGSATRPCGPADLLPRLHEVLASQRHLTAPAFLRLLGQSGHARFSDQPQLDNGDGAAERQKPDATLSVACTWIDQGPLSSTWIYWLTIARREARLRGIAELNGPDGWRQHGVVTAPRGRGDARWHHTRSQG